MDMTFISAIKYILRRKAPAVKQIYNVNKFNYIK